MIRYIRLVLWFCLGLFFGGFATYASADSIPATSSTHVPFSGWSLISQATPLYPSAGAACFGVNNPLDNCTVKVQGANDATCARSSNMAISCASVVARCPSGYSAQSGDCVGPAVYSCPPDQGWTLSGTTCTRPDCEAGQARQSDGTCKVQCPSAGAKTSETGGVIGGAGASVPDTTCIGGCTYSTGGVGVVVGGQWATQVGRATGASCSSSASGTNGTPATTTPPDEQKPRSAADCISAGQGYGTINGTVVCTGPADSTVKKDTKTESVTRPDGSTGTQSTTSTTICNEAGACTTTTTTNVSGGGASGTATNGTTTGTKTQDIGSFCQENPSAPQCKTNEQEDYCKLHPGSVGCMEAGEPSDGSDQVGTKTIGVSSITPVVLATNMSCPPDVALPKNYGTIRMGPACDFAGWVRPLVLAFAWLSAGLIVIGAVRT